MKIHSITLNFVIIQLKSQNHGGIDREKNKNCVLIKFL